MDLTTAEVGRSYSIRDVVTEDAALNSFLFSLGCYSGEYITVVARRKHNCTVAIKDGRYCIDNRLAQAILI